MRKFLLFALLSVYMIPILAQTDEILFYKKGASWISLQQINWIDSITNSNEDYDSWVGINKVSINDDSKLHFRVAADICFSVASARVGLICGDVSNEDLATGNVNFEYQTTITQSQDVDFVVANREYRPVIIAYDAAGTIRSSYVGNPANFNAETISKIYTNLRDVWTLDYHYAFGYPAVMIIRDVMTGDFMHTGETGYSYFISWARNQYMGAGFAKAQFIWEFFDGYIRNVNDAIQQLSLLYQSDTSVAQMLADAYGYRAMMNLDWARMYEFLQNDGTQSINKDGNDVSGLTIPYRTTTDQTINAPRETKSAMVRYIIEDLTKALGLVGTESHSDKQNFDHYSLNGLLARAYLWDNQYQKAAECARIAVRGGSFTQKEEALDAKTGFNNFEKNKSWLLALRQNPNDNAVLSGIINWTSWMSNQTTFGYTGPTTGLYTAIDKSMYNRLSNTDWRKQLWDASQGVSKKFKPGSGNADNYNIATVVDIPLMRVEEMYLIMLEAQLRAGGNLSEIRSSLESFMKTRDASYTCKATNNQELIDEILFQKRVELWGEGQSFFDIKRCNLSVTRGYAGSNWEQQSLFNTNGRPAWMNIVFVSSAERSNEALKGWNNPDPSGVYLETYIE